jgi:hypothetical protein
MVMTAGGARFAHSLLDVLVAHDIDSAAIALALDGTLFDAVLVYKANDDGSLSFDMQPLLQAVLGPMDALVTMLAQTLGVDRIVVIASLRQTIENNA